MVVVATADHQEAAAAMAAAHPVVTEVVHQEVMVAHPVVVATVVVHPEATEVVRQAVTEVDPLVVMVDPPAVAVATVVAHPAVMEVVQVKVYIYRLEFSIICFKCYEKFFSYKIFDESKNDINYNFIHFFKEEDMAADLMMLQ